MRLTYHYVRFFVLKGGENIQTLSEAGSEADLDAQVSTSSYLFILANTNSMPLDSRFRYLQLFSRLEDQQCLSRIP